MSLKKYMSEIRKNQSTSQDDAFMKPDPDKVTGMRIGSYDKLNEKGYVPEETVIYNGDIIIGKVTPIQATEKSNKIYKDSSETYRAHAPGVVDRVYTGIYNVEGYEVRKMRVRSMRPPVTGDKFCCYTPDHDVLTTDGWVPINELTLRHKVACLINGTILEYQHPVETMEYDYDGNMYIVESNQVNLKVTPNHRMYTSNRTGEKYVIQRADEIYGKERKYLKNVDNFINSNPLPDELKGEINNPTHFIINNIENMEPLEISINDWLVIFGIWISEGCVKDNWALCYATHKQRVKNALENAFKNSNIKFLKREDKIDDELNKWDDELNKWDDELNKWYVNDKRLVKYFDPLNVGAVNKFLPEWVWYLTKHQSELLINAMMLGDGHTMKNGTHRYDTSSKKLADNFQRLCLHAGFSTNMILKYEAGHTTICKAIGKEGEIFKSTTDVYRLTVIKSLNNPLVNKNITSAGQNRLDRYENYVGKVFCCRMNNDDGVIYVRRNGYPVWCCNSRHG